MWLTVFHYLFNELRQCCGSFDEWLQTDQINCLNKLIKHLSMNVPRFIYMTDLIRIFRKAGVFEAQTTDEVSK